jgi:hypothetical protein
VVEIRAVRDGDIDELLADVRPADQAEADALFGPGELRQAITASVASSAMCWTADAGGRVAWMFGVAPVSLMSDIGLPWMVGTTLVDRERRALTRLTPPYIARMLAAYPSLANVVDARNVKSIAWLRRAGFKVHAPAPAGVAGLPFHLFTMGA